MTGGDANPWGPPGGATPPETPKRPEPPVASTQPEPPAEPLPPAQADPHSTPAAAAEPPPAPADPPAATINEPPGPYVPQHPPDVNPRPFEKAAPMISWGAAAPGEPLSAASPPIDPVSPISSDPESPITASADNGGSSRFGALTANRRVLGLAAVALLALIVAATTLLGGSDKTPPAAPKPTTVAATNPDGIAQPKEITATTAEDELGGGHVALKVTHTQILRTRPSSDGRLLKTVGAKTPYGGPQVLPILKARGDWVALVTPYRPNNKVAWTKIKLRSKFVAVEYSISIRLSKRTIVVRKNGTIVRRFKTAVGRTGHKTPTGRFTVTDGLIFKPNDRAIYGCCALVLSATQPDLPAGWTGGNRIAMHGTPDQSSIGLAASLGCLRVGDEASRWLVRKVPAGATVFIKP